MSLNLPHLAAQGRAHSAARPWDEVELDALITLERERGLARITAANYVRNGIMTLEAYDEAVKKSFTPQSLEDMHAKGEEAARTEAREVVGDAGTESDVSDALPRAELEAKATALGLKFKKNTSDATLAKRITDAEKGQK